MKYFLLMIFSFQSWAGFISGSKINDCSRVDYISPNLCQEKEGEQCFKVPNDSGECGIFKIVDILQDDLSNPVWATRSMVEPCSDETDCKARHEAKQCVDGRTSYYSIDDLQVWCNKIIGYNKIVTGKEIQIDEALKTQKDAQKAAKTQIEAVIAQGEKARKDCQRVLDLIGGFNLLSGASQGNIDSMVETFALAKQHLQDGRPGRAKEAIQAIPVDGVIVTEQMKGLALEQLKDW